MQGRCPGCYEPTMGKGVPDNVNHTLWHKRCFATVLRVRGFVEGRHVVGLAGLPEPRDYSA